MLPQRYASNACARKMLALSRPKIAVTVSIIVVFHTPRRQGTVWTLHSQKNPRAGRDSDSRLMIPCNRGRSGVIATADRYRSKSGVMVFGSPGRIRTSDQPVNSRLLYHSATREQ